MSTAYPIVANCNYESADDDDREIHAARLAVDAGLTANSALVEALEALEETLLAELDDDTAQYRAGEVSRERIEACEVAVSDAWTAEVRAEVEAERIRRYRD